MIIRVENNQSKLKHRAVFLGIFSTIIVFGLVLMNRKPKKFN